MGMPQNEMAKKLQVSRSTIARDISELRNQSGDWLDNMTSEHGHVLELKTEMDRLDEVVYSLTKVRNNSKNPSEIIHANREIANISKKRWDLYRTLPLAAAFRKFVNEKINEHDGNSRRMAIVPEGILEK